MSYDYISLEQSDEIYKLVINLSIQHGLERFFISKSELNGYNLIDISNGLKLKVAIKYFYGSEDYTDIKIFAKNCDSNLEDFSARVIPDDIFEDLNKYHNTSIHYERREEELRNITIHRKALVKEFESCITFLEFCEGLGKLCKSSKAYNYWEIIYRHLNLNFNNCEFYKFNN